MNINSEEIRRGYFHRRDLAIELLRGRPLERQEVTPPVFSDGSNFSREFSYALVDYAFRSLWLNENIAEANSALLENANYYISYPSSYRDKDSFYWAADEVCSILEFFGREGCRNKGAVTKVVEERIFLMMWQYSKLQSRIFPRENKEPGLWISCAEFQNSKTWHIDESENHHIQRFYAAWHFAKFLKDHADYKNLKYDDGYTAAEHYAAWTRYICEWIKERGKKGLFVEMHNDDYGLETLKGVYNFYSFSDDKILKESSEKLLDLYWALWAQEQLGGVSGGAKSRVYPSNASTGKSVFWKMEYIYLGSGEKKPPHGNLFTIATSNYQMPLAVIEMALDREGRGVYEVFGRRLGQAEKEYFLPPDYRVKPNGGIVRYSYCTPSFIAGTFFAEALAFEDWTLISSQNRWAGVIFEGDSDARLYIQPEVLDQQRSYNQFRCVQSKGSMIFQKLLDGTSSNGVGKMQVYFSTKGLSEPIEKNGWVFVESKAAYAAVAPVGSSTFWTEQKYENNTTRVLVCEESNAPVIVEVAEKKDFVDFDAFCFRVLQQKITSDGYLSMYKDKLTMPLEQKTLPMINEKTVDLYPKMVLSSPFVKSEFDSGLVTVTKGDQKMVIDFTV